jgi:hypothetical protein
MPAMAAAPPKPVPQSPTMGGAAEPIVVEGYRHRKPLLFAAVGVLLTGVIATAVLWPDDDAPDKVAEASTAAQETTPKKVDDAAAKKADAPKPAIAEPEAAVEVEGEPAAEAEPVADEADIVAVAAEADAGARVPAAPIVDAGGSLDYAAEDPAVAQALRNQSIRALDILLISPEARVQRRRHWKVARLRHVEAAAHCDALVVDGVDGWRLPTIGELASLTTANILAKSTTYWSDTKGDTYGNTRVIWAVRNHRMHSVGANNRGARTICVRDAV